MTSYGSQKDEMNSQVLEHNTHKLSKCQFPFLLSAKAASH